MAVRYYYFRAEPFNLEQAQARMMGAAGLASVAPEVTQPSFQVVTLADDTAPNEADLFDMMSAEGYTFVASTPIAPVFTQARHFGGLTVAPTTPAPAEGDEFYNGVYNRPEQYDGTLWNPVTGMYRPTLDDGLLAAALFVDNVAGNDGNDGLTALAAWATIERAIQFCAVNPTIARTINLAASGVNYPVSFISVGDLNWITFQGPALTVIEAANAITSVGASSRANGLTMTVAGAPWIVDQHRGRLVRWLAGTLIGQFGVVYSNTASTISVSQDTRGTFKIPAIGNTFEILEQGATIDFPGGAFQVVQSSSQCNFRDLKFAGATRTLFILDTDKFEFLRCRFDLLGIVSARGGSADFRTTYVRNVGDSSLQNGMLAANTDSVIQLSDGTVIDGAAVVTAARGHVLCSVDAAIQTLGETVFSNLRTNGILIRGGDVFVRRTSVVTDSEWRFVNTCTAGPMIDFGNEGVGGNIDLPDLFGTVTDPFGVDAQNGAYVRIGSASSLTSGLGINRWSADGGISNVPTDADGTQIFGPAPPAPGPFGYTRLGLDLEEISFTFATASPLVIVPIRPGDRSVRAIVEISTTFNGVGAGIQLGTGASPGGILSTANIGVAVVDFYQGLTPFQVGATTDLQLEITPGAGATQGAGRVLLEIWRG